MKYHYHKMRTEFKIQDLTLFFLQERKDMYLGRVNFINQPVTLHEEFAGVGIFELRYCAPAFTQRRQ